jgi:hypothetical protein
VFSVISTEGRNPKVPLLAESGFLEMILGRSLEEEGSQGAGFSRQPFIFPLTV